MNPASLQYRLTPDERAFFNTNGYLIVPDALDPAMTARLLASIDRIDARERTAENRDKLLKDFDKTFKQTDKSADLVVLPLDATIPETKERDAHLLIFASTQQVARVMWCGNWSPAT